MALNFVLTNVTKRRVNQVSLRVINWDDFGFKTQFYVRYHDPQGVEYELGTVKIGRIGQKEGWTKDIIDPIFGCLSDEYFSLGQDAEYYSNIAALHGKVMDEILGGLQDVVWREDRLADVKRETVFSTSLLRYTSMSSILNQFKRILEGGAVLTDFDFEFERVSSKKISAIKLGFSIIPGSKPPTNMHVLIGRNGVGKTTVLNQMVHSVIKPNQQISKGRFYDLDELGRQSINESYFSCVISVSFSAFDPFDPPPDQKDSSKGVRNFYIGLKSLGEDRLKGLDDLCEDFILSFHACVLNDTKRDLWADSVAKLNSDVNFKEIGILDILPFMDEEEFDQRLSEVYLRMSSGHAIVLLTLTRLIAHIEEKTLILLDEPESHLHPPLLSAFTRALSDLLIQRNGVAIIATHSPVVLQEVPRSCVWKLHRVRLEGGANRPEKETFGENVGTLTREVFGLEVANSGFHAMLRDSVAEGKTYDQILEDFNGQLGFEGRSILRSLIANMKKSGLQL